MAGMLGAFKTAYKAADIRDDVKEMAGRVSKGVNQATKTVTETLEDSKAVAERAWKRGSREFEDRMSEAAYQIKRQPVRSVAMAFAAGMILGIVVPQMFKTRR